MHMQSRSVDLDLPRARGALPGTRVCRTLWRCLSVSRAEGVCVWHFQRTTRADLEVIGCCRIWNCTISFASQEVSWAFERPVAGVKQMTSMHLMLR